MNTHASTIIGNISANIVNAVDIREAGTDDIVEKIRPSQLSELEPRLHKVGPSLVTKVSHPCTTANGGGRRRGGGCGGGGDVRESAVFQRFRLISGCYGDAHIVWIGVASSYYRRRRRSVDV